MSVLTKTKKYLRNRRHTRVRKKVVGTPEKPRLCIHKSLKYLYAQLIDDVDNKSLAFATTNTKDFKSANKSGKNIAAAKILGAEIGNKIKSLHLANIVFDRSGYKYHGAVKAFADAVREAGVIF